jgi:hypothetical protein
MLVALVSQRRRLHSLAGCTDRIRDRCQVFSKIGFIDSEEVVWSRQTVADNRFVTTSRLRPQFLPRPQILGDPRTLSGYVTADYWEREDAFLIHPPLQKALCAICRGVPLSRVVQVAAAVHAARVDGPGIGFSVGVAPVDAATPANWEDFMGPVVSLAPGDWGVVRAEVASPTSGDSCDLLLATRVLSRGANDNAWALFRRFSFTSNVCDRSLPA